MPQFASSWSLKKETKSAVEEASHDLIKQLGQHPDLIVAYVTHLHAKDQILERLQQAFPQSAIHGGTTCIGLMTRTGFHSRDGFSVGLFGIVDSAGAYGVASSDAIDDPQRAGRKAIESAIQEAGREGETPSLVWLNVAPGIEEEALLGIQEIIGENVPVVGGSTADNFVAGLWYQFTHRRHLSDGIVVTAMYPSTQTHVAFQSGYSPTQFMGKVTQAEGRLLQKINDRPAAVVYNEWTGGLVNDFMMGGNILATTSLNPLARYVGHMEGNDYHRLSHPETITHDGAMTLFTKVEEGEELILMAGNRQNLITRAGVAVQSALRAGNISEDQVAGGLIIYCAGCMLTVQNGMDDVALGISQSLGEAPFIGTITFGEQGCFLNGDNYHGNLMISVVLFEK